MSTTTDIDPCPYCGTASGVQPAAGTSPRVKAWLCRACQTAWAVTVVNPQLHFDRLAATVEQLGVLRRLIRLADDAPGLSNEQLRARLLTLADRADCAVSGPR